MDFKEIKSDRVTAKALVISDFSGHWSLVTFCNIPHLWKIGYIYAPQNLPHTQFNQSEGWGCWGVNLLLLIVLLIFAQYFLYFFQKCS